MNKLNTFLINTLIIILLSGSVMANVWPSPPLNTKAVDVFYNWRVEDGKLLYITRIYCFVINGKTVINKFYPDNGFDYVVVYRLIPREDGNLIQEKYPASYHFDADGDGTFSSFESRFDPTPDGWNGNEVAFEDLLSESSL